MKLKDKIELENEITKIIKDFICKHKEIPIKKITVNHDIIIETLKGGVDVMANIGCSKVEIKI